MLVLPDGVTLTSGTNETYVGDMTGYTSATVNWTIIFQTNGSYTLSAVATGYDSNGLECSVFDSTAVSVVPEFPSLIIPLLSATATLLAVLLWRRKHVRK